MHWIVIIIILVIVGILYWKFRSNKNMKSMILPMLEQFSNGNNVLDIVSNNVLNKSQKYIQNKLIETVGQSIQSSILSKNDIPYNPTIETIETIFSKNNKKAYNPIENNEMLRKNNNSNYINSNNIDNNIDNNIVDSDNINNISLPFSKFIEKVSNMIIGRYKLIERFDISIVNSSITNIIKKWIEQEQITEEYINPQHVSYNELIDNLTLQCSREIFERIRDPMKKIFVGQYIINKTSSTDEIDVIYDYIISIGNNNNIPDVIRMNAADVLNLSNNNKYMKIARTLITRLRGEEANREEHKQRQHHFQRRLDQIYEQQEQKINNQQNIQRQGQQVYQNPFIQPGNRRDDDNINDIWIIPPIIFDNNQNNQGRPLPAVSKKPERTVYQDGQNVHNSEINTTTLDTAVELVSKYPIQSNLSFDYSLIKNLSEDKKKKIESALHRILTDPSTFNRGITLYQVFQGLLNFISKHPQKDELNKRLTEELLEMSGLCATGHMTRMINVMQGFETGLKAKTTMKIDDEVYAKVKHIIEKNMQESEESDDILEDMLSDTKKKYLEFVNNVMKKESQIICNEYKDITSKQDIIKAVTSSVDKYTGTSGKIKINCH